MDTLSFTYAIELLATVAFASSAVLAVSDSDIDIFGAFFLGIITAVGGGTIRDLILAKPVFWSLDQTYLWVALVTSIITYAADSFFKRKFIYYSILYLDGFGAALFGVIGTTKAYQLNFILPSGPIMMGLITAIGGGLLRDILAARKTLLIRREIYAIPVLVGCSLHYILLKSYPLHGSLNMFLSISCIFLLRSAAIYWQWTMPQITRTTVG